MKMLSLALLSAPLALPLPVAAQSAKAPAAAAPECSAAAMPAAQRLRLQTEYRRRLAADGKVRADTWLRGEAQGFYRTLVDRGVCPPPPKTTASTTGGTRTPLGKDGKPCKRTRMENRNIANPAGGAMSMVLVPVCAD